MRRIASIAVCSVCHKPAVQSSLLNGQSADTNKDVCIALLQAFGQSINTRMITVNYINAIAQCPKNFKPLIPFLCLQAFGLNIDTRMITVNARVLPQPRLAYAQPACLDVGTQGAWNLRNVR